MKRYQVQNYRRILYGLLLVAVLMYVIWSCMIGTSKAIQIQMGAYLQKQAHTAVLSVLEGEEDRAFVSLRRDQNDHITAVTVNGILLNQLQIEYLSALDDTAETCSFSLSAADLLGCKLLSFLPWRMKVSCRPTIVWESNILSRTLECSDHTKQFQLLLVVSGKAEHFAGMKTTYQQDLLLYETVIYTIQ